MAGVNERLNGGRHQSHHEMGAINNPPSLRDRGAIDSRVIDRLAIEAQTASFRQTYQHWGTPDFKPDARLQAAQQYYRSLAAASSGRVHKAAASA